MIYDRKIIIFDNQDKNCFNRQMIREMEGIA